MNKKEQLEAQVKELEDKLSEMKAMINEMKEEKKSFKRWRAENGGEYYFIFSDIVYQDIELNDTDDDGRYKTGNYYKTKKEAERARDLQLAIVRVNDAIDEANEGWVSDYSCNDAKFIIYYSHNTNEYKIDFYSSLDYNCKLKECKTIEITKRIINEFTSELNLIFNVK